MTSSVTVALPNRELAERLSPAPDGVTFTVWDVEDEPLGYPIDLLALRYMLPAIALRNLGNQPVKVVQSQMLGYDGVKENLPPEITYCNAVEVHEASTGELALALVLASLRGIPEAVAAQSEGRWVHRQHPGLAGRTAMLIGVGGVGREIEARLAPFDVELMRVARNERVDDRGHVHGWSSLPELLPQANVVILAVPLTDETRKFVDVGFLSQMKRGALLVNVSRGPIVDTEALTRAVEAGDVTAALDVTDPEPLPPEHPLWRLPGVLITPHVGGNTGAMAGRVDRVIREQLRRMLAGEPPTNAVLTA